MSAGKYRKDHNCLNCGAHVEKHYCSDCGQPNLELNEGFWQFISHSIAHYFHFDNKFFQTLAPLLTKPGKVTLDYLAGKRARYINPVSMYIFVSIVYFLVAIEPKKIIVKDEKKEAAKFQKQKATIDSLQKKLAETGLVNDEIIKETEEAVTDGMDRSAFRKMSFQEQKSMLIKLKSTYERAKSTRLEDLITTLEEIHVLKNDSTYTSYLARQQTLTEDEKDNWTERLLKKREIGFDEKEIVLDEQVERNRSKIYFLFMPLMALFIGINFRKNHIRYLDHLIFTIHGMTAFFIVQTFTQPLKRFLFEPESVMGALIETALVAWVCWYLFKSLKVFYQRKNSTTIWRMVWIICLYVFAIGISEMVIREVLFYLAT
ncbi:MAG: DUF3667 domain-containing protein [Bacteroidota bacterium]